MAPVDQFRFDEILQPICKGKKRLGMLAIFSTDFYSAKVLTSLRRPCH